MPEKNGIFEIKKSFIEKLLPIDVTLVLKPLKSIKSFGSYTWSLNH